ncbi:hypothetical protein CHISP_2490 [Chitinispirillum alkaliphilum]|nr:hypothetical protein CHISP_2490 [Chitinispirillum alkaliphilum]
MSKRIISTAMFLCLLLSSASFAGKQNLITTNPLGMAFGVFNAEYQRSISDNASIGINGIFWSPPVVDLVIFGVGGSYNYYSKASFRGLWIQKGINIGVATFDIDEIINSYEVKTKTVSAFTTSLGALIGYRWTWNTFSLGTGGGISFTIGDFEDHDFGGISPALAFDIGFNF